MLKSQISSWVNYPNAPADAEPSRAGKPKRWLLGWVLSGIVGMLTPGVSGL